MKKIDIIILSILVIITIIYIINYLSLNKTNNSYEILQKDNPNLLEVQDLLVNKSPSIITNEINNWFIFDKNDNVDDSKLNKEVLTENTYKLQHNLCIVKKFNINNLKKNQYNLIVQEKNTRHFIGLLVGELSVYLLNPLDMKEDLKGKKFDVNSKDFQNIKYIEIKLYAEQLLYIPYKWGYCYKCNQDSVILDINSESIFTLPIKNLN